MSVKFNKKCEDDPRDERKKPEYPWVRGEADVNGGTKFVYANPEKPEESCSVEFNHDASFKTCEYDPEKKGLTNQLIHEDRCYVSGGSSKNTDGHNDVKVHATGREDVKGDYGRSTGGDQYNGTGGKVIAGAKEGSFTNDADGNTYKTSKGDVVSEHTGSNFSSLEGDQISSVKGNKIDIVSDGEYQTHVQGGNMDTRVESGKLQIYSGDNMIHNTAAQALYRSIGDMLITSDSKITIKVGSSEIIITPGEITIKSGAVNFVKV